MTLRLIQERARKEAETRNILNCHASRGWVQKFLRRPPAQPSFRLHGKGGVTLPIDHAERMREVREISSQYRLKNIWNMDESGLFYHNGARRLNLSNDENRSETRGMGRQAHKQRVWIVMAVNADGCHSFPVHYSSDDKPCLLPPETFCLPEAILPCSAQWVDGQRWI